jgi:Cof subfamily protein (haloacid dehalogenase superfamily)
VDYRLIVADLDGTLRSRVLGITPGTHAAIAAARARGVRVCVATGRMWPSAAPWVRRLAADPPVILYNGGQVLDFATGRVLYERRLPRETARAALALLRREPEARLHLFVDDRVYVERPDPVTDAYAADDGVRVDVVPVLEARLTADPYKILVIGPPERVEALGLEVRGTGLPVHAVQSEPQYLEILPPGVSKGVALGAMLERLGVPAEAVIAIGDNWNDLEMIEAAGLGVAMGHAPEGVRARADHVSGTSEEDGFRTAVERFVLGRPLPRAATGGGPADV